MKLASNNSQRLVDFKRQKLSRSQSGRQRHQVSRSGFGHREGDDVSPTKSPSRGRYRDSSGDKTSTGRATCGSSHKSGVSVPKSHGVSREDTYAALGLTPMPHHKSARKEGTFQQDAAAVSPTASPSHAEAPTTLERGRTKDKDKKRKDKKSKGKYKRLR